MRKRRLMAAAMAAVMLTGTMAGCSAQSSTGTVSYTHLDVYKRQEEQFLTLRSCGVDMVQGFLLGRPIPAEEFETQFLNPSGEQS